MTTFGPPEHVYVENEWYDGPRSGIADVNGKPHRFKSLFDEKDDEYLGTFLVWAIDADELALEQEQWQIFVAWNERNEVGTVGVDSHPGHPGTNRRWDELATLLEHRRQAVPLDAKRARVEVVALDRDQRYARSGPSYHLSWKFE